MLFLYGNYHQGDQVFGNESRGRQCMANCVVFSALSETKPLHLWTQEKLKIIMHIGDEMYKYVRQHCGVTHDFLLYNDIPKHFSFLGLKYALMKEVSYGGTLTKTIFYENNFSMALEFAFNLILSSSNSKYSAILIFCDSAISVRKRNNEYYLFDPHSRCRNGLPIPDGACHISKFENLSALCSFIRDLACSLSSQNLEQIVYEMIRVEVKTPLNARGKNFCIFSFNVLARNQVRLSEKECSNEQQTVQVTCHSDVLDKKRKRITSSHSIPQKRSKLDEEALTHDIVKKFSLSVLEGPLYVCSSCSQTWFKEGVVRMSTVKSSFKLLEKCKSGIKSVNNIEWVCLTCKRHLMSGKIPECSVGNNMKFPPIPNELLGLTNLEQRLISPRIPFMSIRQQPRGGQLCMKGNVVNVPADINKTVRVLPRTLDNDETVFVKLKRKISFKHSVAQEMIRPNRVIDAVKLLTSKNLFKSEGIHIDSNWSLESRSNETCEMPPSEAETDIHNLSNDDCDSWDEEQNHENQPSGNLDTMLNPIGFRQHKQVLNIAPGEGNTPLGIFQDFNSEFLAFPSIYCGETRMPNNLRHVPLHYSTITPGAVDNLIKHNEGYQILRQIRGSTAYWEVAKKDLFGMIRQLGIPHFFVSLSAAETKWKNLLITLGKLVNNKEYSTSDVDEMSWQDKCHLINSDPVTCVRYFDYRVQKFLHSVMMSPLEPIGKIQDYFYRVEFQQRGSPHIHMVVWVVDGPELGKATSEEITSFVDKHVTCVKDETMTELINYQTHRHARTCRKKGHSVCRFNFPIPPMSKTTLLQPIDSEADVKFISTCKKNCNKILDKLDEMKYGSEISFEEFLNELKLTNEEYCNAVRSSLKRAKLFLKRNPSEIRINSYNSIMLKCWQANIDVQFVLDPYSCASYIVSYISKGQRGMSNLMYRASQEAKENNMDLKHQMRHISNQFLTHVEVSAQEAAYFVLQLPMRRSSRSFLFLNTCPPSERITLLKSVAKLEEMSSTSTNVEADNVVKRYQRRPKQLLKLCLADFASWYDVSYPKKNNPCKSDKLNALSELPEVDDNDCLEDDPQHENVEDPQEEEPSTLLDSYDHMQSCPDKEICMSDGGILKKRKTQRILKYVRFNKDHSTENYYRELIMLFHPWVNEERDIPDSYSLLKQMYTQNSVCIEKQKKLYERNRGLIEQVESYNGDQNNFDDNMNTEFMPENLHAEENDRSEGLTLSEKYGCFDPGRPEQYDVGLDIGITRKQIGDEDCLMKMPENDYRELVRNLNDEQKGYFYHVLHWFKTKDEPVYNFLSGGAGVGKSVLIRAIYQGLLRILNMAPGSNPDDVKVLLCAPTGKAAHNIGGNTIHSTFCIPVSRGFSYKPLAMEQLNTYRLKYKNLKVVIIDEISMVGCKMFNFINGRLQEIMGNNRQFGGVSIIAVGDLYQLKPVMDSWIFHNTATEYGNLAANLWQDNFSLYELKTIMRQKGDLEFAELLNRLREGHHTHSDIDTLKSRLVETETGSLSSMPHLFTTCAEVDTFNEYVFSQTSSKSDTIECIDSVTGDLSETLHDDALKRVPNDPSKTMGLYKNLKIAEGLQIEINLNINIEDGLTNGAAGKVMLLDYRIVNSSRCSIIWVLFNDIGIGKEQRRQFQYLKNDQIDKTWTPIFEVTRKFLINNNQSYQILRRQFPIRLAAAKTIHKSQGSTVNNLVAHLGRRKNDHMHYVAFSRVRSLEGLHILHLSEDKISVSIDVTVEMDRMRSTTKVLNSVIELPDPQTWLNILCHNVRSLHLHIKDVKEESYLSSCDLIGITESRLKPEEADSCVAITGFATLYRHDSVSNSLIRPHHGSVVYSKHQLSSTYKGRPGGIEITSAVIVKQNTRVRVIFLYCPPKVSTLNNFSIMMQSVSSLIEEKTILMGDFNVDIQNNCSLINLMKTYGFNQLIEEVTTDYNTALDLIFVNFIDNNAKSGVLECYYSDHKPIFICLPM
ncbi:uncharacterized protein LOC134705970 [Mytilus trossulus]|uniref:uncharacterized protein LOC134705970 n=1 Tax=Mytilus trossulus TaxID=6551 RepID=UPI003004BD40